MSRRGNGEGSIFKRGDGRWAACYYAHLTDGRRRRQYVYGRTQAEVQTKLRTGLGREAAGQRVAAEPVTVAHFLRYWLDNVAVIRCRPTTVDGYRRIVERHLIPELGHLRLERLTVAAAQTMLNRRLQAGVSPRTAEEIRKVLRSALSRAEAEELVARNVAKHVQVPSYQPAETVPWSSVEARQFLETARQHRLFPAFLMQLSYGLRRGEVLGLCWSDIDFDRGRIRVHQQLQRIDGELQLVAPKTRYSNRTLPLIPIVRALLAGMPGERAPDALVFRSSTGTPVEPRNYGRVFQQLVAAAGVRRIKLHGLRHTTATLLKEAKVPVRDAQLVLGHADALTTLRLYQHGDALAQHDVLASLTDTFYARHEDSQTDIAVSLAVISSDFLGEDSWEAVLASGGTTGARTQDTLLKRVLYEPLRSRCTTVIREVRTSARQHLLGRAAVNCSCARTPFDITYDSDLARLIRMGRDLGDQS